MCQHSPVCLAIHDLRKGGFIEGGEFVKAARLRLEMLDVHLDRLTWDLHLGPPLRPWPLPLLRNAGNPLLA